MSFEILAEGYGRRVRYWAARENELRKTLCNCPNIAQNDEKRILRYIKYYLEKGHFPNNKEKFKKIQNKDGLYEIKSYQMRLFGFFYRSEFIIVLCVQKKKDKHNPSDIKKAVENIKKCKKELEYEC